MKRAAALLQCSTVLQAVNWTDCSGTQPPNETLGAVCYELGNSVRFEPCTHAPT